MVRRPSFGGKNFGTSRLLDGQKVGKPSFCTEQERQVERGLKDGVGLGGDTIITS
jgi:hypothetical protein